MVYVTDGKHWVYREGDLHEILNSSKDPDLKVRPSGLGLKGVDLPAPPDSLDGNSKSLRRRMSARRSMFLFRTKSADSIPEDKEAVAQASASASPTNQAIAPEPERVSPTLWRTSNPSTISLMTASSWEDISTYHSNLARYKSERAEREVELGLRNHDLSRPESLVLERPMAREDSVRKSAKTGLSKGLKTYWGSNSPGNRNSQDSDSSRVHDAYWDMKNDKEALKAWWDQLGQ